MNLSSAAGTQRLGVSESWQIVQEHAELIEQIVDSNVKRGVIKKDKRNDAVADGQLLAFELTKRSDVENFSHLLARSISRSLLDEFRPGTDALDRTSSDEIADFEDPDGDTPGDNVVFSAEKAAPTFDLSKVPERWRKLAHMAHVKHHTVSFIAKHTGYSPHLVRRMMTHTLRLLIDRKDRNGRLFRRKSRRNRQLTQRFNSLKTRRHPLYW